MPTYDLYARDGSDRLDRFDAADLNEAIALTRIRLEHQDVELWQDGVFAAAVPKVGAPELTRHLHHENHSTGSVTL